MLRFKRSLKSKALASTTINISGIEIQLIRKNIKNINFSVNSINRQVRVSAPIDINDDELLRILESKSDWMHKKVHAIKKQPKESPKDRKQIFNSGEHCYFLGNPYKLEVIEQIGKPTITARSSGVLTLCVRKNTSLSEKERLLNEWYRAELKQRIPLLIEKWQPIVGKKVADWGVKQMKTRWGTCNITKKRIWLNLELAKQPEACLEYVVVHEMTHLLERNHNSRFRSLLDEFIPDWRRIEAILNKKYVKGETLEEK